MLPQGLEVEAVASEIAEATMPTVQRVAALEAEIRCVGTRQEGSGASAWSCAGRRTAAAFPQAERKRVPMCLLA